MGFFNNVQVSAFKGVRSVRRAFFPFYDPMGEALIQTRSGVVHFDHHMIKVRVASRPILKSAAPVTPVGANKELELLPMSEEAIATKSGT